MNSLLLALAFALPNPALTPGKALPVTAKEICRPGYSRSVRNVSMATKKAICKAYGKKDACPRGYEIDHLISLELGGSNDPANLWPQPWKEAREKDKAEGKLHGQVCHGKMSLEEGQQQIKGWKK